MTPETAAALGLFAFVGTATPGPNNLMLMASGANFGFRRTIPHMAGITSGFTLMIALVGLGVMRAFDAWPASYTILQLLSLGYMAWLTWKIATAAAPGTGKARGEPFGLLLAAGFQWVNPKAWAMSLSAIGLYAADHDTASILIVAATFGLISIPVLAVWTVLGLQLRRILTNPRRLRAFNLGMAALLVLSLLPALAQ